MLKSQVFWKLPVPNIDDKILLLTHTDMDGSGASILMKSVFNNITVEYCSTTNMSYMIKNAVCQNEEEYDYIFVCDISCNEEDAEKINNHPNKNKLVLIDHHSTAINLNNYDFAVVYPELLDDSFRKVYFPENTNGMSSGTSLLFDYLDHNGFTQYMSNPESIKRITHMIAAYDTWDWVYVFNREQSFCDLDTLFEIYRAERFENKMLMLTDDNVSVFDETDRLILDIEHNRVNDYLSNVQKAFATGNIKIDDKMYSIVFCTSDKYMQETFEHMKTLHPDYDIYMINYGTGLALRAVKPEIHVGKIAKMHGGGGHPGAAGIKVPFELQTNIIEQTLSSTLYVDEKERR